MRLDGLGAVEVGVAVEVRIAGPADAVAWAVHRLVSDPSETDADVIELAGLTPSEHEEAPGLLRQIVGRTAPAFDLRSADGERIARTLFTELCRGYLRGEERPVDLCEAARTAEWVYDFPSWIGDLWNACDGLGEDVASEDVPHLTREVERVLDRIGRAEDPT